MTTKSDLQKQATTATALRLETSREYAERLLTSGTFAMNERRTNPELYQAGRRDQIRLGRRAPNVHEQNLAIRAKWDGDEAKKGSLTAAQVMAMTEFPEAQCRAITAAKAQELKRTDPAQYAKYRLAAATFDILPKSLLDTLNVADEVAADEVLQIIPSAIAEKLGLDPALKLTKAGFDKALESYANAVAAEKIAALTTPQEQAPSLPATENGAD